jgi:hypothetical protein
MNKGEKVCWTKKKSDNWRPNSKIRLDRQDKTIKII